MLRSSASRVSTRASRGEATCPARPPSSCSPATQRPFLNFGIPFRLHDWNTTFITWLEQTGQQVDCITDDDLDAAASGDALASAYDLIVFPGHEEYVTRHMTDVIQRYRDLGGNLA